MGTSAGSAAAHGRTGGDLFHPGVGLVLLLVITVLNVYKPRGLTPYGWRKQQEERARPAQRAPAASRPEVPNPALAARRADA